MTPRKDAFFILADGELPKATALLHSGIKDATIEDNDLVSLSISGHGKRDYKSCPTEEVTMSEVHRSVSDKDDNPEQIFEVLFDQLITEQTMCTFILELCDMDEWQAIDLDQWVFDKINEKPKIAQSNDYINKLYVSQKKKPLKVALFTDIHLDYDYLVGAKNAKCGRIICCRADSGEAENDEEKAGFWGS